MARIKASSTKDGSAPASAVPSFLVYPVPSIADETFLQLIFRNNVRRSLFFGFGRSRMAVAELKSAEVAQEVETALKAGAAGAAAIDVSKHAAQAGEATAAPATASPSKSTEQKSEEAGADVEELTLADMFAPPAEAEGDHDAAENAADGTSTAEAANHHSSDADQLAALMHSTDFSHLPCLVYRGRPVHVVVSGVRVADFYESGGAVPEKHENKEDRSSSKKKFKKDGAEKRARDTGADGEQQKDSPSSTKANAAAAATAKFPKNACQKCGSLNHFTRHCDGSGATAPADGAAPLADASAASTDTKDTMVAHSTPDARAHTAPQPGLTSSPVKFPKDCCQKCGSPNHFTRHCDGSGVATPAPTTTTTTTTTAAAAAAAVADTSAAPAKKMRVEEPAVAQSAHVEKAKEAHTPSLAAPAAAKPKPVTIQRTSKDQCKFCGSDAHLSRHCPNK